MNKIVNDSVPGDLKPVIDNNSGIELAGHIGSLFDEYEAVGRQAAVEQGNEIYQLPPAELENWKSELAFVTDDWLKQMQSDGYDAQTLLDEAHALIAKYAAANQ